MIITLTLACHIAALVCFALAAGSVPTGRVNTIGLGLFLWFLPAVVILSS